MRQADPICMWCALADADRPVGCDARGGAITHPQYLAGDVTRAGSGCSWYVDESVPQQAA
jgi:hypothetical protein